MNHLLIIGILAISFSISVMIRSQAADYGLQLNEFDPFFNFRATQFLVDNGISEYLEWHDDMSWHPKGRDISATSQVMLHITAATMYKIFGGSLGLYEFTIIFPVIFGSLTSVIVFALVRVLGGTTAGLFSALFYSFSIPIIVRGTIGWFKSEPLGLFYGILGLYLFFSGINSQNKKITIAKLIGGGIFLAFGLGSWGGIQFFIIPLGMFFIILPLVRKDHKFLIWAIPLFSASLLVTTLIFERPGVGFVLGLGGISLIGSSVFLIGTIIIQKISRQSNKTRNAIGFIIAIVIIGSIILVINAEDRFLNLPSFRYLNAINPFLITENPLVDSVAEHATTTLAQSFYFLSVLMIFAGLGIWLILRDRAKLEENKLKLTGDNILFALIIGLVGVYVSAAFVRLEIFASLSVIILSSIGLAILTSEIFSHKQNVGKRITFSKKPIIKISYVVAIVTLLLVPTVLPVNGNWVTSVKAPPTILNGGTNFNIATDDWLASLEWIKNNTPDDSVIAAWWDYGYWITTLGERKTLADNATIDSIQIQNIAKMFLSSPEKGWELLNELDADYVLVYVAAQLIPSTYEEPLYLLQGGADESKKQWFIRIAEEPLAKYLYSDGVSATPFFWNNTILGQMFPFAVEGYVNLATQQESQTYQPGFTPLYTKTIKFPETGDGPLKLVYSSSSFSRETPGPISGVLIYQINKDYSPSLEKILDDTTTEQPIEDNTSEESLDDITTNDPNITPQNMAIIKTNLGNITIKLYEDIAPKTVENFRKLASEGFYDGTIFHRIIPGFVIQGGDPNTILGERNTWGMGGPGYSLEPEFNELHHKKYIVSMARGIELDSAGSQFFIVIGDAPWLDGQYTIFGEVVFGQAVVDQIASLPTNSQDQPIDKANATMNQVILSLS